MTKVPAIGLSPRLRPTPFTPAVEAAPARAYTVYNHMRLATVFETLQADYRHLKRHVQLWDVACERQVEIAGPDAARLVQWMTPRDLATVREGVCAYVPLCDETGGMLNDPVALKVGPDRWWLSVADSDVLLWAKGLAYGAGLNVTIDEPDIWPLAVQGPKAEELMARVFGDEIRQIRFFRFRRVAFRGREHVVARSGWSKQGGFEIYVDGAECGLEIWNALADAGRDLEVRPGCPNNIERVEGGLISYGNDITRAHTPYQAGLGHYCHPHKVACIGREALIAEAEAGPPRQLRCLAIDGAPVPDLTDRWPLTAGHRPAGLISSAAWSPDFRTNVALAMVDRAHWDAGTRLTVHAPDGLRTATVQEKTFI